LFLPNIIHSLSGLIIPTIIVGSLLGNWKFWMIFSEPIQGEVGSTASAKFAGCGGGHMRFQPADSEAGG
jgi:hypothetical protein